MPNSIPILMYHQVSPNVHPNFNKFTVTTDAFKAQMNILKLLGFNPITFNEFLESEEKVSTLPSKPIIITFDDALEDTIENTLPILEKSGFKAVFYTPTQYLGKTSSWMLSDVGVEFRIINRQQLKNLDTKGFEIGSHTITHPHLTTISSEDCYTELRESRKELEDILGHEVKHVAYPYGHFNDKVKTIARESGYDTACTSKTRLTKSSEDLFSLPRINVGMDDSLLDFILKIYTAYSSSEIMNNGIRTLNNSLPKPAKKLLKKLLGYQNSH